MAVLLKSIIHTHTDAKAVFKDPTGEIQGTVHRQLLEDRAEELKVGAVLLLKQVGVFSPSHRNHYLNVTPNNLLRIYAPDGVGADVVTGSVPLSPREPVSRMHLVFDEEDDEGENSGRDGGAQEVGSSSRGPQEPTAQDAGWDEDDDLDELLGQIPEDTYSL
ncbi:hypothetical protein INR49_003982 [Caranx melampygus]|nr:hypothetical protein INR49_003982 [Caranx melampygus]